MNFGVDPPWYQDLAEYVAFNAYAYNQQKIEDLIDALAATPDPNDFMTQRNIARNLGICIEHLTDSEIEYVEKEVANRYGNC